MSSTTKTVAEIRVCLTCFEKFVADPDRALGTMCDGCAKTMNDRIYGRLQGPGR